MFEMKCIDLKDDYFLTLHGYCTRLKIYKLNIDGLIRRVWTQNIENDRKVGMEEKIMNKELYKLLLFKENDLKKG